MPADDILISLRVSTVADSAKSIYELMTQAADEIEGLRVAYKQALATIESVNEEVRRLQDVGDALAATGGQHGFDEALDKWKLIRKNFRSDHAVVRIVDERPQ
jgi:hypothetical protein